MQTWGFELRGLLELAYPGGRITPLNSVLIALGLVAAIIVLNRVSNAFEAAVTGPFRSTLAVVLALILPAVSIVAVRLYALPHISNHAFVIALPYIALGLTLLVIVVPVAMFLFRGHYFQMLVSLVISAAAATAVVILLFGATRMITSGGKFFNRTEGRTKEINESF